MYLGPYRTLDGRPSLPTAEEAIAANRCAVCRYYTRPGFIMNAWRIVPCFECNQDNRLGLPVPNEISQTVEGQKREL